MLDIRRVAPRLLQDEDGIWFARARGEVSYPAAGNADCFPLEEESFWFQHRNRCILELLRRHPPPGAIVDVGGGNGYVARAIQQAGHPVALLEPGREGAQNAKRRGIDPVICATLEGAGFLQHSLPAVGIFDVLEHMSDDVGFLRSLHALLVPGGMLYLTVPAYPFLKSQHDEVAGHHRRYSMGLLTQRLGAAGFHVGFQTHIFSFLPIPVFLTRTLPYWIGMESNVNVARSQREHRKRRGILGAFSDWVLRRELACVRRGRPLPFGGSCMVAARSARA